MQTQENNIDGKPAVPVERLQKQGNVDKGTTRTDTMILERQRGITIQTAVTSFAGMIINQYCDTRPYGFLTEAYRSLSVLTELF